MKGGCRECTSTKDENKSVHLHRLNTPTGVLSSLRNLHWFALQLVHLEHLNLPLTSLEQKKKSQTTFLGCWSIHSEYPSNIQQHKKHSKSSLEVFQKHVITLYFHPSDTWDASFWYLASNGIFFL